MIRALLSIFALLALATPAMAQTSAAFLRQEEARPDYIAHDEAEILIRDVTVIDGTGAPARPHMSVLIRDGRIAAVGPVGEVSGSDAATVIQGAGRTLIPGLVLMHEHMFYPTGESNYGEMLHSFPRLYLAGGVTTLRTAGSMSPYADLNLRDAIAAGEIPGPDMDITAPYLEGPGLPIEQVNALEGADDAERMVRYWAAEGASSYKVYMNIRRAELDRIIELAHANGQRVTGHLCSITYREAAEAGIDNLEHGFFAATDFVENHEPDTCPGQVQSILSLLRMDPASPESQALIQLLVEHDVALTSTLTIIETFTPGRPRTPDAALDLLTPPVREQYESTWTQIQPGVAGPMAQLLAREMAMERAFVAAGGTLLAGTDPTGYGGVIPGFSSWRQLQLLLEAGFTLEEVVQITTLNGAEYLGRADDVGSIEIGKRADLVLLAGDAATGPLALDGAEIVFKAGVGYDPQVIIDSLQGAVGLY